MYRQVLHSKILRLVHTMRLCVLYGSETSVDHFPVHLRLVFVTDTACLLCGTTWIFTYISGLFSFLKRPFHSLGGESLAFHRGGPDSMPVRSLCYLWLTKWYWDGVFSEWFVLLLSLSQVLRTHLCLYAALPGQTGEVWEPSKKAVVFWKSGSIG